MRDVKRILIVDDEQDIATSIADSLSSWDHVEVFTAGNVAEAVAILHKGVDVVLTDVRLGHEDGLSVARAAAMCRPAPVVIAMSGVASVEEGVRLGHAGVMACMEKPVRLETFQAVIRQALESPPSFLPLVHAQVGKVPLAKALGDVRGAMLGQALGLVSGNRSGAARLLGITRQAVQQMLRVAEQPRSTSRSTGPRHIGLRNAVGNHPVIAKPAEDESFVAMSSYGG